MKNVYRIWALLLIGAILFSCAKETFVDKDTIAGGTNASVADDGSGENGGNGGDSNGGEDTTPVETPEFIDNNDWSAYDENEYLIGFGAVDETDPDEPGTEGSDEAAPEGSKATINLSTREVAWESADEATVYVPATGASGTYAYDATRKQFRPKTNNDIVALGNNLAYVYYPSSLFSSYSDGTATVTMPGPVAVGSVEDLGDKLPMAGIIPANQGKPYPTVTFRNLGSVLRVQLTGCETITSVTLSNTGVALAGANAGSVTWSGGTAAAVPTLAMSGDTKSVTVSCGEGGLTLDEDTPTEFYFLLPSSGTMSSMKVRVNFLQDDGTYTYTPYVTKSRNGAMTLERNKIIKLAFRAGFFSGGDGTALNPYQIATPADLSYLQRACSGYGVSEAQYGHNATVNRNYFRGPRQYLQTADIDFDGEELVSIGSASRHFFGSYDGDNHTISDMVIDDDSYWVGLFGYVDGGTIENLTLSDFSVSSTNKHSDCSAGALAGLLDNDATVSGCTVVSSTVTGVNCGGLVGYVEDGTVSECIARGVSVTAANTTDGGSTVNSAYCGGIAGCIKDGSVNSCSLYGAEADGTGTASSITGVTKVGGIVGDAGYDSGTTTLSACYVSNASISATGDYAGGQVGYMHSGASLTGRSGNATQYSVCRGQGATSIQTSGNFAGGIAGFCAGSIQGMKPSASYTPLANNVDIVANENAGGVAGGLSGSLTTCYATSCRITALVQAAGGIVGRSSGTLTDCITRYDTIKSFNASEGTSGTYKPIAGGIIGYMVSGTLDNSGITATSGDSNTVSGYSHVGGAVGMMAGTLIGSSSFDITSSSTLYAENGNIGGVVGRVNDNSEVSLSNCSVSSCAMTASVNMGGIVGYLTGDSGSKSKLYRCVTKSATYTVTSINVGGIVGRMDVGEIEQCVNKSTVTGGTESYCVGGIVGRMNGGSVNLCYSAGSATISGKYMVGGLVGFAAGNTVKTLILNSASRSAVTSTGASDAAAGSNCSTGGVVGYLKNDTYTATLANCANLGENLIQNTAATAYANIGGVVGCVSSATVRNCYAYRTTGKMKYQNGTAVPTTANSPYGGIFGLLTGTAGNNGQVMDCYYCCDEAGKVSSYGTTGTNYTKVTSTQMNTKAKVSVTVECNGQVVNNWLRVALTFGARQSDKTTRDSYTADSGTVIRLSEYALNENIEGLNYPLAVELYSLRTVFGEGYYDN